MRRIRVLASLVRLEREALDRRRRELATLEDRLATLRERVRELRDAVPSEIAAGLELPGGPAPLGRWLTAIHERARALRSEAAALEARRERASAEVGAQYVAKRRQELILERARAELRAREGEREQKQLDELAVLRSPRAGPRSL